MILLVGIHTKTVPLIKNKHFQLLTKILQTRTTFMFHIETNDEVHILGLSRRLQRK